jgi:endonuclease-8
LLHDDFDFEAVLARLRERNELVIGVAVMRQHLLAGIGNVYKSEVLFLCKTSPFIPVGRLSARELKLLVSKSRDLMKLKLEGKPRDTLHALDGERTWVYGRSGRPCRTCGTLIKMQRQGDEARSTYWCPQCQALPNAEDRSMIAE